MSANLCFDKNTFCDIKCFDLGFKRVGEFFGKKFGEDEVVAEIEKTF